MAKNLYKTTIVIWSDFDPHSRGPSLEELGRDAEVGGSYCSDCTVKFVPVPEDDPEWDGTEFFGEG